MALQINRNKNIPSREGQTFVLFLSFIVTVINPLPQGANAFFTSSSVQFHEKSPPTRGKLCLGDIENISYRNIPSNKGQTFTIADMHYWRENHPLQRGANASDMMQVGGLYEKSHPARGKPEKYIFQDGIT